MPEEDPPSKSDSPAPSRLQQLSSHLNPPPPTKKKPKNQIEALPADYSDVLTQIAQLKKFAATPDTTNRGYIRQKTAGKLWVRERIDALFDKGSFKEVGSVGGTVEWKQTGPLTEEPVAFTPSNNVQGFGRLRGRRVLFTADDFSVRAGHADGAMMEKTIYMENMAIALRLPMIKLVDGSSGGGSVTTIKKAGWSYIPHVSSMSKVGQQLNMGIPNLGAVLGPAVRYSFQGGLYGWYCIG
jgi:acetyl-CoA carboxylase carboxyltransferase component